MTSGQPVHTTGSASRSSFNIPQEHRLIWVIGIVSVVGIAIATIILGGGGGAGWQSVNAGSGRPVAMTVDATHETVLVGSEQGQVFSSNDAGQSWTQFQTGLPAQQAVSSLLVLPDSSRFIAGTSKGIYATNGTQPWQSVSDGLPTYDVFDALAIATADNETILAGSAHSGIFITHDGGMHWTASNSGLPPQADIYTLLVSQDLKTIWAGTVGNGIYASSDGGTSWLPANMGLPATSNVFALVQATIEPAKTLRLLAGTNQGVFSSDDSGGHWQSSSVGIGNNRVLSLGLRPSISPWIVAGTDAGVALSIDYGVHWQSLTKGLPAETHVGQLVLIHNQQTVIFAASDRLYRYPGANNPIFSGALRIIGFLVLFGLLFWVSRRQNNILQSMLPPSQSRQSTSSAQSSRQASSTKPATLQQPKREIPLHIRGGPPPVAKPPSDKEP